MQLRRKSRMTSEVSTHSLNDIMFFLMLFFLIVSTLGTSVIQINVPKSNAGNASSKQTVTLSIDSNLTYYLDKEPIEFADLEPRLSSFVTTDTSKKVNVLVQASKKITVQDLVDVLSVGHKLKINMVLATNNK